MRLLKLEVVAFLVATMLVFSMFGILSAAAVIHSRNISAPQNDSGRTKLEVINRVAGQPSSVVPLDDWLLIALGNVIEVRSRHTDLVREFQLPVFVVDLAVSDDNLVVGTCQSQGIILLRFDDFGFLELLDYFTNGTTWGCPEIGSGFICVRNEETEGIQIITIVNEALVLAGELPARAFSVSSCYAITYEGWNAITCCGWKMNVWNLSNPYEPYVIRWISCYASPTWFRLRGPLLALGGWNDWFDPLFEIVDLSRVLDGNGSERSAFVGYGMISSCIAWNSKYLYLHTDCLNSPECIRGFIALSTTDLQNISVVGVFDEECYSGFFSYRRVLHTDCAIAGMGSNFVDIWNIDTLTPLLAQNLHFRGYVSDLALAPSVRAPIVTMNHTWGYPVVHSSIPVFGYLEDIKVVGSHAFFFDEFQPMPFYEPVQDRFELPPVHSNYELTHPSSEFQAYGHSFYRAFGEWNSVFLWRWTVIDSGNVPIVFPEEEMILEINGVSSSLFSHHECSGDLYCAASVDELLLVNLTTLEWALFKMNFSEDLIMVRISNDSLFVLDGQELSVFRLRLHWLESPPPEFLAKTTLLADVMCVEGDLLYAANASHVMKYRVCVDGSITPILSITVPAAFAPCRSSSVMYQEPGDLVVNYTSGRIYRAGGFYGIWEIAEVAETTPLPNDTVISRDMVAEVIFVFVCSMAGTAVVFYAVLVIVERRRRIP